MNVHELIEILKELDQDKEVLIATKPHEDLWIKMVAHDEYLDKYVITSFKPDEVN